VVAAPLKIHQMLFLELLVVLKMDKKVAVAVAGVVQDLILHHK
jgi:hypothetical protein